MANGAQDQKTTQQDGQNEAILFAQQQAELQKKMLDNMLQEHKIAQEAQKVAQQAAKTAEQKAKTAEVTGQVDTTDQDAELVRQIQTARQGISPQSPGVNALLNITGRSLHNAAQAIDTSGVEDAQKASEAVRHQIVDVLQPGVFNRKSLEGTGFISQILGGLGDMIDPGSPSLDPEVQGTPGLGTRLFGEKVGPKQLALLQGQLQALDPIAGQRLEQALAKANVHNAIGTQVATTARALMQAEMQSTRNELEALGLEKSVIDRVVGTKLNLAELKEKREGRLSNERVAALHAQGRMTDYQQGLLEKHDKIEDKMFVDSFRMMQDFGRLAGSEETSQNANFVFGHQGKGTKLLDLSMRIDAAMVDKNKEEARKLQTEFVNTFTDYVKDNMDRGIPQTAEMVISTADELLRHTIAKQIEHTKEEPDAVHQVAGTKAGELFGHSVRNLIRRLQEVGHFESVFKKTQKAKRDKVAAEQNLFFHRSGVMLPR